MHTFVIFIFACLVATQPTTGKYYNTGKYYHSKFGKSAIYVPGDHGQYKHMHVPYNGGYGAKAVMYIHIQPATPKRVNPPKVKAEGRDNKQSRGYVYERKGPTEFNEEPAPRRKTALRIEPAPKIKLAPTIKPAQEIKFERIMGPAARINLAPTVDHVPKINLAPIVGPIQLAPITGPAPQIHLEPALKITVPQFNVAPMVGPALEYDPYVYQRKGATVFSEEPSLTARVDVSAANPTYKFSIFPSDIRNAEVNMKISLLRPNEVELSTKYKRSPYAGDTYQSDASTLSAVQRDHYAPNFKYHPQDWEETTPMRYVYEYRKENGELEASETGLYDGRRAEVIGFYRYAAKDGKDYDVEYGVMDSNDINGAHINKLIRPALEFMMAKIMSEGTPTTSE